MNPTDYKPRVGLWSQRDLRWANKLLGKSKATMGPKGCAVTCMAIILLRWYWDIYKKNPEKVWRPGDLCDWMSKNNRFTPQGDAYLNSLDTLSGGKCVNIYNVREAKYTMIMVMWGESTHWVVQLGRKEANLCLDPWDGKIKSLTQPHWRITSSRRWFKVVK